METPKLFSWSSSPSLILFNSLTRIFNCFKISILFISEHNYSVQFCSMYFYLWSQGWLISESLLLHCHNNISFFVIFWYNFIKILVEWYRDAFPFIWCQWMKLSIWTHINSVIHHMWYISCLHVVLLIIFQNSSYKKASLFHQCLTKTIIFVNLFGHEFLYWILLFILY